MWLFGESRKEKGVVNEPRVECVVVGYGVSTVPIINELQEQGIHFVVITEERFRVWKRAAELNVNFDLVSSHEVSYFRGGHEYFKEKIKFPFATASEYFGYLEYEYEKRGHSRHIQYARVGSIEECADRVKVKDEKGHILAECDYVVYNVDISTKTDVVKLVKEAEQVHDSTILIEGFGDSASLLIGKLCLNPGNEIHIKSNNFYTLDKVLDTGAVLDQGEMHWMIDSYKHPGAYLESFHALNFRPPPRCLSWLGHACNSVPPRLVAMAPYLRELKPVSSLYMTQGTGTPAKYWPVDKYFELYKKNKEHMLQNNILLNDIWFLEALGVVSLHAGNDSVLRVLDADNNDDNDHNKTFDFVSFREEKNNDSSTRAKRKKVDVHYKFEPVAAKFNVKLISADGRIVSQHLKARHLYKGMLHPSLSRVFFCGALRPQVGGFALLAEGYRLFFKYIWLNEHLRKKFFSTLPSRIHLYNKRYLASGGVVNGVWAGVFVHDLAINDLGLRFVWNATLSFSQNIQNLAYYLIGPTNVVKLELYDSQFQDPKLLQLYADIVRQNGPPMPLPVAFFVGTMEALGFLVLALASFLVSALSSSSSSSSLFYHTSCLSKCGLGFYCLLLEFLTRQSLFASATFRHAAPATILFTLFILFFWRVPHLSYFISAQCFFFALSYFNPPTHFPNLFNCWARKKPRKFMRDFAAYREDFRTFHGIYNDDDDDTS